MAKHKPASMRTLTTNIGYSARSLLATILEAQLPTTKQLFEQKKFNVVAEKVIENFTPHSPLIKITTTFEYVARYTEIKEKLLKGQLTADALDGIDYADFKPVEKAYLSIAIDGLSGGQVIINATVLNPSNEFDLTETSNPTFNQCLGTSHARDLLKLLSQLADSSAEPLLANPYFELRES